MSNSNNYSPTYAIPLDVQLHRSRSLRLFFIAVTVCVLVSCLLAGLSPTQTGLLLALSGALIFHAWRVLYGPQRVVRIQRLHGQWRMLRQDGSLLAGELADWSYLSRWLVVVAIKPESRRAVSVPVPWDALPTDQHRQLRRALQVSSLSE